MKEIWIIGIGKFGLMAVNRLERVYPNYRFILVDTEKEKLIKAKGLNRSLEHADGVSYLLNNLHPEKGPDWIIPALPVHLLAEWIIARLKADGLERIRIPIPAMKYLPNFIEGKNGDLYVSHADFICPDDCPEPGNVCYVTGQKRTRNMFDLLQAINLPGFRSIVVRSHQLAPGVGGYRPEKLFQVLQQVSELHTAILLSTACRCHGVITGVKSKKTHLTFQSKPLLVFGRFLG
jgi:hypothetical protein